MKKLWIAFGAILLSTAPLALEAKRPENRVPVSAKHYDHDLHQYSPFFDIDLDCDTIQWTIEDLDQQKAHFDIRDRKAMRIDQTILADLTHGSITPKPTAKKTLYVSNVRKAKSDFILTASCLANRTPEKDDD